MWYLLPLLLFLPEVPACTTITHNPTTSFTLNAASNSTSLNEKNLTMNLFSIPGSWSATLNYTDLSSNWRVYFKFIMTNCRGSDVDLCVGNGFSFILHNSGIAYLGPQASYLGCCPENSLSVMFNFYGQCESVPKPFLTLQSNQQNLNQIFVGTPPPGTYIPTNISTCNIFHEAMIDYNGRFLSVYLVNMETPWIYHEVNLPSMIPLKDRKLGYITWGVGDAGDVFSYTMTNVTSFLNCTFPEPHCNVPPFICSCDMNCSASDMEVSRSTSLSNGIYMVTGQVNIIQILTVSNTFFSTRSLNVAPTAALNIINSNVTIFGNLNISSNSSLSITLSESHGTPMSVMGCSWFSGSLIVSGQTPVNSLVIGTNCSRGVFTITKFNFSSQNCYDMNLFYDSNGVWVVFGSCKEGYLKIIAGCVGGGLFFLALVIGIVWYIIRQRSISESIRKIRGNRVAD